jgi:molybdate transport system regulatory protein
MELASTLSLEMFGKPFLLEKRIRLLHAIKEHGSISKAAKAVPMSYKSAWEAVDAMNNLASEPIVVRETGGKNGGGTTITAYGKRLLQTYTLLKEEHTRFLDRLSSLSQLETGELQTIGRLGLQISARNQIQAEVEKIVCHDVNATITLRLKGGQKMVSMITTEAVNDLHIEEGKRIVAVCKSSNLFILQPGEETRANRLHGRVISIQEDRENVKITLDIGGHDTLVSVMPAGHFAALALHEGDDVTVAIRAKDILIGR